MKLLLSILAGILFSVIIYLIFAFIGWELDISKWGWFARLSYIFIAVIGSIVVYQELKEK